MKHLIILIASCSSIFAYAQEEKQNVAVSDSILLQEVMVKADKKLVILKSDRYVVDATQIRKGKSSLMEVLRDVPGIIVNKDNVSIIGKGGMKVMINGRLKQIPDNQIPNLLNSYSASEIKNVEVVYHTGAEYDASGNYGILNIVLDKPKENFIGGDISNSFTVSDEVSNETGLNLKFNRKKFTSVLSVGYNHANEFGWQTNEYAYTNVRRDSRSKSWDRQREWRSHWGIDYTLDSLSVISADVSFSDNRGRNHGTDHILSMPAGTSEENQRSNFRQKQPRRYWNASVYVDRKWNNRANSQLILDYYNQRKEVDYRFASDLYDGLDNLLKEGNYQFQNREWHHMKGFSFALDQTFSLPLLYQLKMGMKGSFSTIENESVYDYTNMDTQDNHFDYDENCLAAYAVLTHTYLGCLDVRAGGRYEHTFTEGVSDYTQKETDNYGRLFPDLQLAYRFKGTNRLALSYTGSVIRPWMSYLNPFRLYSSPYVAKEGTPTLRPSYFNKIELSYQMSFGKGFARLYTAYSSSDDLIAEVLKMTAGGTSLYKWENAYEQKSYQLGYMLNWNLFRWMKASLLGSFSHNSPKMKAGFEGMVSKNTQYSQMLQLSFIFDKQQRFTGSLFGSMMTPRKTPFEKIDAYGYLRGGLNYSLLDDKLGVGLYIYNIIPVSPTGTYYSNDGMTTRYKDHTFRTSACLTLSYTFGKDIREKMKVHSSSDVTGRFSGN